MKILAADDDKLWRKLLERVLSALGHEVVVVADGLKACEVMERADGPELAILDWMMPGLDGPAVCRKVRKAATGRPVYLILLTAKGRTEDLVVGLDAGADDYITKPFDVGELRARVSVGVRVVELQMALAARVAELEQALARVKQLHGLLPICSYCKRIRDDSNYWQQVESYIGKHAGVQFSHGICPACYESHVKPEIAKLAKEKG